MIEKFTVPFLHYRIKNFLNKDDHKKIKEIYSHLEFYEKHTDLFHFFQTHELNANDELEFFQNNLKSFFSENIKNVSLNLNIFASFYNKGHYLLCHDDLVDDRKFAFSYYLEDYDSGALILFDDKATKEIKRIKVEENTLVIFEVSKISYHEVDYCKSSQRMAFTGWFNYKDAEHFTEIETSEKVNTNTENNIDLLSDDKIQYDLTFPKENDIVIDYEIDFNQEITVVSDIKYNISDNILKVDGPFYNRKIATVKSSKVFFNINQLKLIDKRSFLFRSGDYILLNDPINDITENIFDLFYFNKSISDDTIKYVDESGAIEFEIEGFNYYGFIVQRKNRKIFIERVKNEFKMEHFTYQLIN